VQVPLTQRGLPAAAANGAAGSSSALGVPFFSGPAAKGGGLGFDRRA
jgi:hypothetical protein